MHLERKGRCPAIGRLGSGETRSLTKQCLLPHLVGLAVLLSGFPARGATDACLDRTIPVNVFTEGADQITTLKAADFRASVGKKRVQVTSAT